MKRILIVLLLLICLGAARKRDYSIVDLFQAYEELETDQQRISFREATLGKVVSYDCTVYNLQPDGRVVLSLGIPYPNINLSGTFGKVEPGDVIEGYAVVETCAYESTRCFALRTIN